MTQEKKFSLVGWEQTEEFKRELEQALQRFDVIRNRLYNRGFECTFLGDLRMDNNGHPEAWINDNMPLRVDDYCKKPEDAIHYASRHGDTGWWSLDELEQFEKRKGPIFESAMWKTGYRISKVNPTRWARKNKGDKEPMSTEKKQIEQITGEELERLDKLWVMRNESAGMSRTYGLDVGTRGMIYIALWANPFAGSTAQTLWMLADQVNNRAHIARQQNGFCIDPKNVRLGSREGIYIKAVKPDTSYVECIWPVQIPAVKICDLADDLVSRVK